MNTAAYTHFVKSLTSNNKKNYEYAIMSNFKIKRD